MTLGERYHLAAHKVQSAIAVLMSLPGGYDATSPKHMRTGVDMSKADQAGLATLLIAKGVFTKDEYLEAVADSAELEAERFEKQVSEKLGYPVTLG